ncbi:MAG: sigma 54-interacting transcriptional regulator [Planctomycetota bacterium]
MEQIKLNAEVWKKVFTSPLFHQTTTLFKQIFKRNLDLADFDAMGITIEEWNLIRGTSEPIPFPFCDLITETKKGDRRCLESAKQAIARISNTLKTDICTCYAGLTEVCSPIVIQGKYCGCASTFGGLLLHQPNEAEWQEIAERVKSTGVDLEKLKKAYFDITPISKELLEIMLKLLNVFIEEVVKTAIEIEEHTKRINELEKALYEKYQFANIIGRSKPMCEVYKLLDKVITTDYPVVIQGETGTGKELVARAIHYNSPRKDKPFITQNCAALSETLLESELFGHIKGSFTGAISDKRGLFEQANLGTFFLDEIGDMSLGMQAKLLRVIENGEIRRVGDDKIIKVDVRIISATNKDLKVLIEQDGFREDLYYRIQGFNIHLPPLRERKEDIPLLINHFSNIIQHDKGRKLEIDNEALRLLMDYNWPGNVRELDNEIRRLCVLTGKGELITAEVVSPHLRQIIKEDIPKETEKDKSLKEQLEELERRCIIEALQKSGHKKILCAKILGINRNDLTRKMKRLRIQE